MLLLALICFLVLVFISVVENLILKLMGEELTELASTRYSRWVPELLKNPKTFLGFFVLSRIIISTLGIISSFYAIFSLRILGYMPELARFALSSIVSIIAFLLFGHIIPTRLLKIITPKALPFLAPVAWVFYRITYPVWHIWGKVGGIENYEGIMCRGYLKKPIETEEIEDLLEDEKMDMMRHIFEFGETIVKEVMIPRIDMTAVSIDTPIEEVVEIIKQTGHSRIPVYRETVDNIVGVVYAKDILTASLQPGTNALEKLLREPYFVPETKRIDELFRELRDKHLHIAIVVDEYGGTAGIITMEDLIEELVGEIEDEYDKKEELFKKIDDNTFIVSAKLLVADVNEEFNLDLPEEGADTIGGLIFELKGGIPRQNESFIFESYKLEVLETRGNRVIKVKITRSDKQ
jgi:putative hemolysin